MILEINSYALSLWLAALVCAAAAAATWSRPARSPATNYFAVMMVCVVIWVTTSAMEASVQSTQLKILLSKLGYVGNVGIPPLFLLFSVTYARRDARPGAFAWVALWIIPAATLCLALTNEWHHLLWTDLVPLDKPGSRVLLYRHGAWYWIWVLYYGGVSLLALVNLAFAAFQYRTLYRLQTVVLLVGVALPWAGEILYISQVSFLPGLDLAALGFGAMGVLVLVGTRRFALFRILPIARTILVQRMSEGVIVLDLDDRVVDINPAAQSLLQIAGDVVGRPGGEALPALKQVLARGVEQDRERHEMVQVPGPLPLTLELVISELGRSGEPDGRLVVIRDVTIKERLVRELQAALADVRILRGLIPICSSCKKIRDDKGAWHNLETYIQDHSEARFSHGLCNDCSRRIYPDL